MPQIEFSDMMCCHASKIKRISDFPDIPTLPCPNERPDHTPLAVGPRAGQQTGLKNSCPTVDRARKMWESHVKHWPFHQRFGTYTEEFAAPLSLKRSSRNSKKKQAIKNKNIIKRMLKCTQVYSTLYTHVLAEASAKTYWNETWCI